MQSTSITPVSSIRRLVRLALFTTSIALVVVAGWFGWRAYRVYQGITNITGHVVVRSTVEPQATPPAFDGNKRINFLVLGSDNDRKKEEATPLTQSMIVVSVDPINHKVSMLSIPRDFYVPIRGHGRDKIMLAFKYGGIHGGMAGGVQLARETVERNFRIHIDYYAWVGLNGFIRVIDTFGGVTLDVKHPVLDDFYPDDLNNTNPYAFRRIFIPAGWEHLPGSRALEYVRSRHGDLIGDFSRSARQQQVLLELHTRINALNVLLNLESLVAELQGKVLTDLSIRQIYDLGQMARHIQPQDITQVVLQYPQYSQYGEAVTPAGRQSILVPTWSRIRPLIRRMFSEVSPQPGVLSHPGGRPQATPITTGVAIAPQPVATTRPSSRTAPTVSPTKAIPRLDRLPARLVEMHGHDLVIIERDGNTQKLGTLSGATMLSPSPNGRFLALARFTPNVSDLWTVDIRSRRFHRLTNNVNRDIHNDTWAVWPSWTQDSRTILFSSDRAKLSTVPSEARSVDLSVWSFSAQDGSMTQLTQPQLGSGGDTEPTARPATSQFLYVRWDYLKPSYQPYSQLVLKDRATGGIWSLTPAGGRVLQPQWDPSGKRVVFVKKNPQGVDEIAVAPLVITKSGVALGPRNIVAAGRVAQPAFTPDGKWVSYLKSTTSGFSLYLVSANGGQSLRIDQAGTDFDGSIRPVWLP